MSSAGNAQDPADLAGQIPVAPFGCALCGAACRSVSPAVSAWPVAGAEFFFHRSRGKRGSIRPTALNITGRSSTRARWRGGPTSVLTGPLDVPEGNAEKHTSVALSSETPECWHKLNKISFSISLASIMRRYFLICARNQGSSLGRFYSVESSVEVAARRSSGTRRDTHRVGCLLNNVAQPSHHSSRLDSRTHRGPFSSA